MGLDIGECNDLLVETCCLHNRHSISPPLHYVALIYKYQYHNAHQANTK